MMNPLPYEYPITQDVYGKLFASVGRNESGVQAYFRSRAQRVSSSGLNLALDTTTFSTYSKNQIEARQGFNKDGDGLDTIKLRVLYSVENREPVAFSKQLGNIPDKTRWQILYGSLRCWASLHRLSWLTTAFTVRPT